MTLVYLEVNGVFKFAECKTLIEAKNKASEWLAEAKKSFPNKEFKPVFYSVKKVARG